MKKITENLKLSLHVVGLLWVIYIVSFILPFDIGNLGVHPRSLWGLPGIFFMPFIHGSIFHLLFNSVALGVLLLFALSYNKDLTVRAIIIVVLVSGIGVWIFGTSSSVHIGASGVIFGLIGYLIFIGYYRRDKTAILISILVLFLYGGTLLQLLFVIPGVSWSGHFFGFVGGIFAARQAREAIV